MFGFEAREGRLPRAAARPYPLMLRPRAKPWLMDEADDAEEYAARYHVTIAQANGGLGESNADHAFRNHCAICPPGGPLVADESLLMYEVDMDMGSNCMMDILPLPFLAQEPLQLTRHVSPAPYMDACKGQAETALEIAAQALAFRILRIGVSGSVLGISGGSDSTLALLICCRAAEIALMQSTSVLGLTMPGFGTSQGTHENALRLMHALNVEMREISIVESVRVHFRDISQDEEKRDVTYENAQARERGQIIMDLANQTGRLAVGTGDMSELAMGFTTLGGDHLSMYGVVAGIPKTIVQACLSAVADRREDLRDVLRDILATPISPELLPTENGWVAQCTEHILGPYPVIDLMEEQKGVTAKGGTMRLGAYPCTLKRGSKIAAAYGKLDISERHRHRYEFNNAFLAQFEAAGMHAVGINPDTGLVEAVEIDEHPWFIGVQYHPEYKSTVLSPSPLFVAFVKAALDCNEKK